MKAPERTNFPIGLSLYLGDRSSASLQPGKSGKSAHTRRHLDRKIFTFTFYTYLQYEMTNLCVSSVAVAQESFVVLWNSIRCHVERLVEEFKVRNIVADVSFRTFGSSTWPSGLLPPVRQITIKVENRKEMKMVPISTSVKMRERWNFNLNRSRSVEFFYERFNF